VYLKIRRCREPGADPHRKRAPAARARRPAARLDVRQPAAVLPGLVRVRQFLEILRSGNRPSGGASASNATVYNGSGNNADLRVIAARTPTRWSSPRRRKPLQQIRKVIPSSTSPRAQVLVEAVIAEVSASRSSDLGVDWLAYNPNTIAAAGILNSSTSSALSSAATALSSFQQLDISTSTLAAAAPARSARGTALVASPPPTARLRRADQGAGQRCRHQYPVDALLVTLDNQEAKIEVGPVGA